MIIQALFLCKNLSKPNIWIIRIGIRVSRKVGFTLDIFKWEGGEPLWGNLLPNLRKQFGINLIAYASWH